MVFSNNFLEVYMVKLLGGLTAIGRQAGAAACPPIAYHPLSGFRVRKMLWIIGFHTGLTGIEG